MGRLRVRRIGNSLGVIIPKKDADRQGIHEGDELEVQFRKARRLSAIWGALEGQIGSVDELNDLVDEGEDLA